MPLAIASVDAAAHARAELLAHAEMAGLVRKGAALASRFVKAGEGPAADESQPSQTSAGVCSAPTQVQDTFVYSCYTFEL
jgi:hypothetical protein